MGLGKVVLRVGCALALCATGTAFGDESTEQFFEGLRLRRLFSLAEGYCFRQLDRNDLTVADRTEFTIELARTFAEHAQFTTGAERDDLWRRAKKVLDDPLAAQPAHPHALLFRVQRSLVEAKQAEFLRWEADLAPHSGRNRDQAAAAFNQAVKSLRELETELSEELRSAANRRQDEQELGAFQLRELLYLVRFELGRTLIGRAKLSADPVSDADLVAAEDWLRPIAAGGADQHLTEQSRLVLIELTRLRGDSEETLRMINSLAETGPSQSVQDELVVQRVRLLWDVQQPDDAADLLVRYRRVRGRLPGELAYLKVKTSVALWQFAREQGKEELATKLYSQIQSHVERAEYEVGGYWGARCRKIWADVENSNRYGGELAKWMRKARTSYQDGRFDQAAEEFQQAVAAAEQTGEQDLAVQLAFTRASILLQIGRFADAADGFQRIAATHSEHDRTADAHLLYAYSLGRVYAAERTRERREEYTAALAEHRERFTGDTRHEASWMLARLEQSRWQWTKALPLLLEIPADHRHGPSAQVAAAKCYESILDRLRELGEPTEAWEVDAIDRLTRSTKLFPNEPQPLSLSQAELSLRLARLHLNRSRPNYYHADRLLERAGISLRQQVNQTQDEVAASLLQTVIPLRIVSLAGQQRLIEASELMPSLSGTTPTELLSILDGLRQLARESDDNRRRDLGELQLQAAIELAPLRDQLNASQQKRFDHCLAESYAATGQTERAIEVYQQLAEASPDDRELIRTLAALQMKCGSHDCLTAALTNWRRLEVKESPGNREWLDARYHVIQCTHRLGQPKQSAKLLAVTRVLYPDLGGGELKRRFESLGRQINAN